MSLQPPVLVLYDLQSDPREFDNVAGRAKYAEAELRVKVAPEKWRHEPTTPIWTRNSMTKFEKPPVPQTLKEKAVKIEALTTSSAIREFHDEKTT